jgi:hypothetical protein
MALDQFALARKRAGQQSQAALQSQQEAIKRRFASIGGSSSGAAMKAEQLAAEKVQEQMGQTEEGIAAAEGAEKSRLAEIEQARQFAVSERQSQQDFAKGEAEKARQFAIAERGAGEKFQSEQAGLNRAFQERAQAFAESEAGKAMDLALRQFEQDASTTELNKRYMVAMAGLEGITPEQLGQQGSAPTALAGNKSGINSTESSVINSMLSGNMTAGQLAARRKSLSPMARKSFDKKYATFVKSRSQSPENITGGN